MRFSYWELSHRPAQKIEPYLPLIGVEGVSHLGLARFQFQTHAPQPVLNDLLTVSDDLKVRVQHDKGVCVADYGRCPTHLLAI